MQTHNRWIELVGRLGLVFCLLLTACGPNQRTETPPEPQAGADTNQPPAFSQSQPDYYEAPEYEPPTRTSPEISAPAADLPPERGQDPVELLLAVSPAVVNPGDPVTLTVSLRNQSGRTLSGLTFTDRLESGLAFVSASGGAAFESGILANALEALPDGGEIRFSYTLRVTSPGPSAQAGEIWLHQVTLQDQSGEISQVANAVIAVGTGLDEANTSLAVIQEQGGWVPAGDVAVYFPDEAVARDGLLVVTRQPSGEGDPDVQFELSLLGTAQVRTDETGQAEEQRLAVTDPTEAAFAAPVFLEVNFDQVASLQDIPAGQEAYIATYYEEYDVWVKVPILDLDYAGNTALVQTNHFSTWGAGLGASLPQNGTGALLFEQPYTSLFTGAAQYSLPVWTPPGRAGLSPDVSLSYSSATVNGVLGDVQAPWVGMGWNIDSAEIVRKITTSSTGYGYTNSFALALNGALYELVRDEFQPNRYYVRQNAFLYIELHNYALRNELDPDGNPPGNDAGEWWEVVTTDGLRYRFGWNQDSEQLALMYGYACTLGGDRCLSPSGPYASSGYAGKATNLVPRRWRVDRVTDTYGNSIAYTYTETQPAANSLVPPHDRASYLSTISYTGYQIQFDLAMDEDVRSGIGDVPTQYDVWDLVDETYLDRIRICYGPCSETGSIVVRTYDLGYSLAAAPNPNGTLTLTSLAISGGNYYEDLQFIGTMAGSQESSTRSATVRFSYENKPNRASGMGDVFNYPRLVRIENGYGGRLSYTYESDGRANTSWYNYRVQKVDVENGLGLAARRSYVYATPVYTGLGSNPNFGELIGYTTVTEKVLDYLNADAVLVETRHQFGTSGLDIGREYWNEVTWNSTVYQKTVNTYVTDNSAAPSAAWNYRYLAQTENYLLSGGALTLISKTAYFRDPATGNLLLQSEYLGSTLYRKTYYEYRTNPDPQVYLLNTVSRVLLVDANNYPHSDTYYYYGDVIDPDPGSSMHDIPIHGKVTLTQARTGNGDQTVDSAARYDAYGNLEESRLYESFGSVNTAPSGSYQATTIAYDPVLHTYATSTTNALNEVSSAKYLYTLGVPYQISDANNWKTITTYDGLGRTLSVTPPGLGQPGVWYSYPAPNQSGVVAAPYAIEMQIYDQPAAVYRSVWGIYDGLGRILQNQAVGAHPFDANLGNLFVTEVAFNPRGLIEKQSVPHYVSGNGGTYITPAWNSPFTSFLYYDPLGRQTRVTAPDSIITSTSYDGLTVTQTDPNGNQHRQVSDGLGRMLQVQEFTGSTLYATTQYQYDVADRLVGVTDAQANTTRIQYNMLGQKTGMDDPDMGIWSYSYNPTGTLASQTDARSQTLTFAYDKLNRLIGKTDGSTTAISYAYGNTDDQHGMRIGMVDQSGSTSWAYANYGRTVTESKTIDTLEKVMITEADWLGRVLAVTYPDGEVLTYSYDELGRPASLTSHAAPSVLLAELAYDQLGRIASTGLGNGVEVTNTYDSALRLDTRTAVNSSDETFMAFRYDYDFNGNITRITDQELDEVQTYGYDGLNRLTAALGESGLTPGGPDIYRQDYSYDKLGNILQVASRGEAAALLQIGIPRRASLAPLFDADPDASMAYDQPQIDLEQADEAPEQAPVEDQTPVPELPAASVDTNADSAPDDPISAPAAAVDSNAASESDDSISAPIAGALTRSGLMPFVYPDRLEADTREPGSELASILAELTTLVDPYRKLMNVLFPGMLDYQGPQRVVTTYSWKRSTCSYRAAKTGGWCYLTLYAAPNACPAASSTAPYFNKTGCGAGWGGTCGVNFSCSITLSSSVGGCTPGQSGCTQTSSSTTYPPATISGTVSCSQMGNNGWCVGTSSLSLTANEPVSGHSITTIEGTQNGSNFSCTGATCTVPLAQGTNTFTYWAHSTWGDTSQQGTSSGKLDSQPPQVSLSGVPVTCPLCEDSLNVSVSTADADSGIVAWALTLDGVAVDTGTSAENKMVPVDTTWIASGVHTLSLSASDGAGNENSTNLEFMFDPALTPLTYASQPDEIAGADVMIASQSPNVNFGEYSLLFVGEESGDTDVRRALLEFDLSSIPPDAIITRAALTLTVASEYSDNPRALCVHRMTRDWQESEADWNSYSSGNAWQAPGAGGGEDMEASAIGCLDFSASETPDTQKTWSLDIAAIQAMVAGEWENRGFLLRAEEEQNDQVRFYSSGSEEQGYRPILVIDYCVVDPSYTPVPTTPRDTATPTYTRTPSATDEYTPSHTWTFTPSNTHTPTITVPTNTSFPTRTPTSTSTPLGTSTATATPTRSATPTPTTGLGTGLMGFWSFDNVSGTSVPDDSGRSHPGTLSGSQVSSAGRSGPALVFDGVDDYVSIPYHTDFAPSGSFTVAAWVNPEAIVTGRNTRLMDRSGVFSLQFNTNGYLQFQVTGLTPDNVIGPQLPLDQWNLVVAAYDSAAQQLRLYVNDEPVAIASVTGAKATNSNPLYFSSSISSERFRGRLDEARFYSRVLTAAELRGLFNMATATPRPTNIFTSTRTQTSTISPTLPPQPISKTGWSVRYYDSQEIVGENGAATNAIDGSTSTIWHTKWNGGNDPLPHEIQIDLGASYLISGLKYLPRQDGIGNGRIGQYEIYISPDGTNWATPVATGTFPDTASEKSVSFATTTGRYVRLRALTEAGNRGPWTSVADINVIGYPVPLSTATITPISGPTVTPIYPGESQWGTGQDGDLTIASGNTYNISTQNRSGRTCPDGGDGVAYSITQLTDSYALVSPAPAAGCLAPNDEILLVNMRGSSTSAVNAGRYEFLRVASVVGSTVYFTTLKIRFYGEGQDLDNNIGTGSGQQRVVIQRVPNYADVSIDGTLTANPWDGNKYGLLAFRVAGILSGSGTIQASALGYRGGVDGTDGSGGVAYQGESYAGLGALSNQANLGGGGGGNAYKQSGAGGGYGLPGAVSTGSGAGTIGGLVYGSPELGKLFLGSGGGGGSKTSTNQAGGSGGIGGGILLITADQVSGWTGSILSNGSAGSNAYYGGAGGGGAGGSIRIEGRTINLGGSLSALAGTGGISTTGGTAGGVGGVGRIAIYYQQDIATSDPSPIPEQRRIPAQPTAAPTPLALTPSPVNDSIFNSSFEGQLWGASDVTHGGNLATSAESAYWGDSGLELDISDNNSMYVQDDSPQQEKSYRARFYFNLDQLTMAAGDQFFFFTSSVNGTNAFRVVLQRTTTSFQIRLIAIKDDNSTVTSSWFDLSAGWHALEIQYQAAGVAGASDGAASLYLDGLLKQSLTGIDNDTLSVDTVKLGATYGLDTGTRGTLFIDDFDSRRFSAIGLLPDPGVELVTPTPQPRASNAAYAYDSERPHAVTSVTRGTVVDTFAYDANGSMTCRTENGSRYNQLYNAENRMSVVQLLDEGIECPPANTYALPEDVLATWIFTYDGDGTRVKQAYGDSNGTLTTYYFAGGAYEVQAGTETVVRKYYSFAGMSIAMDDGTGLKYFLTDHLGSVVAVTDAGGGLLSQQRYLPFGGVRTDVGTVTQTDFGYTFQRNLDVQPGYDIGLMDYRARFYDPNITHFTQPDILITDFRNPELLNRYSYVANNPIRFTDPSGNMICGEDGSCWDDGNWSPQKTNSNLIPRNPQLSDWAICNGDNRSNYSAWCNLVKGSPCAACHSTFLLGQIPTDQQLDPELVDYYRYLDPLAEQIHPIVFAAVAGITSVDPEVLYGGTTNRAVELHTKLVNPFARRMTTTAVLTTNEGITFVGSSEAYLDSLQQSALLSNEIGVLGQAGVHAEIKVYNAAISSGLTPNVLSVSRPVCLECYSIVHLLTIITP